MTHLRCSSRRRALSGFSLIEVTLAVAIIAVGLIAIIGVLPHGLQASRDAADNTLAATIVQDIFSDLRTQPFAQVNIVDPLNPTYDRNLNTYSSPIGNPDPLNFAPSGSLTNPASAYYRVAVSFQSLTPLAASRVQATVVWPAQAFAPRNTNVFITQVARYD